MDDNHLNKHAMHLIRLLMMAIDILEKHEIITCRQEDLPLLMKIREGEYMLDNSTMSQEFFDILDQYEHRFQEAARKTSLPDGPDMTRIASFVEHTNRLSI